MKVVLLLPKCNFSIRPIHTIYVCVICMMSILSPSQSIKPGTASRQTCSCVLCPTAPTAHVQGCKPAARFTHQNYVIFISASLLLWSSYAMLFNVIIFTLSIGCGIQFGTGIVLRDFSFVFVSVPTCMILYRFVIIWSILFQSLASCRHNLSVHSACH